VFLVLGLCDLDPSEGPPRIIIMWCAGSALGVASAGLGAAPRCRQVVGGATDSSALCCVTVRREKVRGRVSSPGGSGSGRRWGSPLCRHRGGIAVAGQASSGPLRATPPQGEEAVTATTSGTSSSDSGSGSSSSEGGSGSDSAASAAPAVGQPVAGDDAYDGAGYGDHMPSNSLETFSFVENRRMVNTNYKYMDLPTIMSNITERKTKVFLLLEEMRRLKIQERKRRSQLKRLGTAEQQMLAGDALAEEELLPQESPFRSAIPLLPDLNEAKVTDYYRFYAGAVAFIIIMGGLVAPTAELYIGLNGTSYAAFIEAMHLPSQLAQVDPIVASFTGGAVGVLSALMAVEINNVKKQIEQRCPYCSGSGYLTCMACSGTGKIHEPATADAASASSAEARECETCSGTGKVLCVSCLGTGMIFATEHDIRLDPFSAE